VIAAIAGLAGGTIGVIFGLALSASSRSGAPVRRRLRSARWWRYGCFAFRLADAHHGHKRPGDPDRGEAGAQPRSPCDGRFTRPTSPTGASWVRRSLAGWRLVGAQLEGSGPVLPHARAAAGLRQVEGRAADRDGIAVGVPIYAPPTRRSPRREWRRHRASPARWSTSAAAPARAQARRAGLALEGAATVLAMALAFLTLLSVALARYRPRPA